MSLLDTHVDGIAHDPSKTPGSTTPDIEPDPSWRQYDGIARDSVTEIAHDGIRFAPMQHDGLRVDPSTMGNLAQDGVAADPAAPTPMERALKLAQEKERADIDQDYAVLTIKYRKVKVLYFEQRNTIEKLEREVERYKRAFGELEAEAEAEADDGASMEAVLGGESTNGPPLPPKLVLPLRKPVPPGQETARTGGGTTGGVLPLPGTGGRSPHKLQKNRSLGGDAVTGDSMRGESTQSRETDWKPAEDATWSKWIREQARQMYAESQQSQEQPQPNPPSYSSNFPAQANENALSTQHNRPPQEATETTPTLFEHLIPPDRLAQGNLPPFQPQAPYRAFNQQHPSQNYRHPVPPTITQSFHASNPSLTQFPSTTSNSTQPGSLSPTSPPIIRSNSAAGTSKTGAATPAKFSIRSKISKMLKSDARPAAPAAADLYTGPLPTLKRQEPPRYEMAAEEPAGRERLIRDIEEQRRMAEERSNRLWGEWAGEEREGEGGEEDGHGRGGRGGGGGGGYESGIGDEQNADVHRSQAEAKDLRWAQIRRNAADRAAARARCEDPDADDKPSDLWSCASTVGDAQDELERLREVYGYDMPAGAE